MNPAENRNDFDKISRRIAKLDPPGFLAWLMGVPSSAFHFRVWEDTHNIPFPMEPNRYCDTVAAFSNLLAHGQPWLLVIEFQTTPDSLMFGRLGRYMMDLWLERKPDSESGSRYWIGGAVINLTGTGNSSRNLEFAEAKLCTKLDYIERNLQNESASALLQEIEAGQISRCVLPLVVLMTGGDDPVMIQKWIELAMQEPSEEARREYGFAIQTLAELAGREGPWNKALKEWNVVKSKFVEQFVQMGEEKGIEKGIERERALAAQESRAYLFEVLQEQFQQIPADLRANIDKVTDRTRLLQMSKVAFRCSTLEEFRAKLCL